MASGTLRRRTDTSSGPTEVLLRTGPFHEALRAAIDDSGLTLGSLRARLAQRGIRVSLTSLSYWQQGRSRPERPNSLRAVQAIEVILGLPRHSLVALLGPPRPRGRWAGREAVPRGYEGFLEPADALDQTVESVLGPSDRKLRVFFQEDIAWVGADRTIRRVRTRMVVRALEDDADRHVLVYCGEQGAQAADLTPAAVENCRLGRVRRHLSCPVIAVELLFDRRLRTGETYLLEYALDIARSPVSHDYRRAFRYPAETYVLGVRFDSAALPVRCHRLVREPEEPLARGGDDIILSSAHSVHLAEHDIRPGVLGIAWEWD
ncbi:hypothetical protein HNR23_002488 [Nocardiopsis mwathae]|uniref:XRE family transcriptional regulator n=1 Tax=Nocardiopsis mwathae TaxID=1472723 RepID=A0A7X0D5M8_9ACTN|nr:hypothetical protein [Nocardiopsis mwathae]MBB6172428.1 hypothetical protein [Nocardiopsis mwathae]